jgi:phosphoenolpyruvate carboxykinase (GTP)
VSAQDTPIGYLPHADDIDIEGLGVDAETLAQLLSVDKDAWRKEMQDVAEYFEEFDRRIPELLAAEHEKVVASLK